VRIELGEIAVQLQRHALIDQALVLCQDSEQGQQLVAYLTAASDNEELDITSIRQAFAATLPDYMVPSHFMVLSQWPLTRHGKVDRQALPAPNASGLVHGEFVAPEGALEIALAEIWQELLKLERVGRFDNFYDLGGHSLLALRLIDESMTLQLHGDLTQFNTHPADLHLIIVAANKL